MARIREFKGLRPNKDLVNKVSVLPYDVVSTKEARELARDNRLSFFHISKPEIDFPEDMYYQDPRVYAYGKKYLEDMINDGVMQQDAAPRLYLYTQILDGREQTGLIACVSIDDYLDKTIKRHELTRKDKENDRANHIDILNANTGQVFLFFNDEGSKKSLFQKAMKITPVYDFISDDRVRQIVRIIDGEDLIASFKRAFQNDVLYIADGHHRAAAAVRVGQKRRNENLDYSRDKEFNWFMAVIFPHNQLKILSYNRIVHDLNGLTKEGFINKLSENFDVQQNDKHAPGSVHEVCMYMDHAWYLLSPRFDPGNDPIDNLDVALLQTYILGPILAIHDPRTDRRIDFIGGEDSIRQLVGRVDSGSSAVAFSLFPTSIEQLVRVADADKIMPPKSTWFIPKLQSGLVIHLL